MFERPNWLTRKLARSNSLAAREEIVTDFKVSSDLRQLKSGHSENFNWTSHVHYIPRTSLYVLAVQLSM